MTFAIINNSDGLGIVVHNTAKNSAGTEFTLSNDVNASDGDIFTIFTGEVPTVPIVPITPGLPEPDPLNNVFVVSSNRIFIV